MNEAAPKKRLQPWVASAAEKPPFMAMVRVESLVAKKSGAILTRWKKRLRVTCVRRLDVGIYRVWIERVPGVDFAHLVPTLTGRGVRNVMGQITATKPKKGSRATSFDIALVKLDGDSGALVDCSFDLRIDEVKPDPNAIVPAADDDNEVTDQHEYDGTHEEYVP